MSEGDESCEEKERVDQSHSAGEGVEVQFAHQ